jgi:hypothetical protein
VLRHEARQPLPWLIFNVSPKKMAVRRKSVIVVRAVFVALVAYIAIATIVGHRKLGALESTLQSELRVGDPAEKIEAVLRSKALEPFYVADEPRYSALISKNGRIRNFVYVYVDSEKKVSRIEFKSRILM